MSEWDVELGDGAVWRAWHTWTDARTTRVDGYVEFRGGHLHQLDIVSVTDECCMAEEVRLIAGLVWKTEHVTTHREKETGVVILVVPEITTENIHIAIDRWVADGMRLP